MKVTTFLVHNKGSYIELKSFFDMGTPQLEGCSFLCNQTNEYIPSEVHTIYIISWDGSFDEVGFGYSRKHNLKLLEAYPNCLTGRVGISNQSFNDLIKPVYTDIRNTTLHNGFLLSNEFKDCQVYGLDYFLKQDPKKRWSFETKTDDYIFRRIGPIEIMKN
ncbi:hypothetical protein [Gelidibacter sp.]|uniref:hypothetical protein n=1 Tax=Gelidibacter sp. TaxID=2018083 RepID=UPI002CFFF8E9|nr:hypothetical protein [Gelidibacter sp.]HUH26866.1 hypothetical protein [Gelidibacter sp.]